jgi:hypothetical protein
MLGPVRPGYHSGQRLASLNSAMVSCGEALTWTLRCTIAIVDPPSRCRQGSVRPLDQSAAAGADRTIVERVTYGCQRECRPASKTRTRS